MRTALYRHFDADGALLYVGISLNSIKRTMQHRSGARWFEQIARITIEWLPSREEAEQAERNAIRSERPANNVVHALRQVEQSPGPSPAQYQRLAVLHPQSGRLNGWFFVPQMAEQLLGWFRAIFPSERFELVDGRERSFAIYDEIYLDAFECAKWTASEPNYDAGDAFDAALERQAA